MNNKEFITNINRNNQYNTQRWLVIISLFLAIIFKPESWDISKLLFTIGLLGGIIALLLKFNIINLSKWFTKVNIIYIFIETLLNTWLVLLIIGGIRLFMIDLFFIPTQSMMPNYPVSERVIINKFDKNYHKSDVIVFQNEQTKSPYIKRIIAQENDQFIVTPTSLTVNGKISEYNPKYGKDYHYLAEQKQLQFLPSVKTGNVKAKMYQENNYMIISDESGLNLINNHYEARFPHQSFVGKQFCQNFTIGSNNLECTVPKDYYFVMGDNRTASYDGRYFGVVHKNEILGKVIYSF